MLHILSLWAHILSPFYYVYSLACAHIIKHIYSWVSWTSRSRIPLSTTTHTHYQASCVLSTYEAISNCVCYSPTHAFLLALKPFVNFHSFFNTFQFWLLIGLIRFVNFHSFLNTFLFSFLNYPYLPLQDPLYFCFSSHAYPLPNYILLTHSYRHFKRCILLPYRSTSTSTHPFC